MMEQGRRVTRRMFLAGAALAVALMAPAVAAAEGATPRVRAQGTVRMDASLSHEVIPNFESSEVWASIKLEAREFVSEERAPLNIALVIDRSSSMSGNKIRQAREAAERLLSTLGPEDRLSIVSYSSDVRVDVTSLPVTSENRPRFLRAIRGVEPGGFTNLSGGFDQGCELVSNTIQEESINRVMLMSDGRANRGVTDARLLARRVEACLDRGVSLTTIGLGLDYNEDLMTAMARAGAGNYHFIEDEAAMARVFEREATGLATTVARRARLRVEVAPGVEMLEVHGYRYRAKGNVVTIPLAEFISKQRKEVMMKLSVSAQESGARPIVDVRLSYEDVLNARDARHRAKLSTRVSASRDEIAKNLDRDVLSSAQKVQVAATMERAMGEYERGNRERAVEMIRRQRAQMKEARSAYNFEDDSAYDRVDAELGEMEEEIEGNAASSARGKKLRKAAKKRSFDIANDSFAF